MREKAPLTLSTHQLTETENGPVKNNKPYHFTLMSFHAAQHAAYCAAATRLIATSKQVPSYRAVLGKEQPNELILTLITQFLGQESSLPLLLESLPPALTDTIAVRLVKLVSLLPGAQSLPALNGLASKKVPFISNRFDPLKEDDLDTGSSTFQLPYLTSLLTQEIKQLKEETLAALNSSRFYSVVANIPFFNQATTYSQTLVFCDQLLNALNKKSIGTLSNLASSKQCPEAIRKLVTQFVFYHNNPDKKLMSMKEWDKLSQEKTHQGVLQNSLTKYNQLKGLGRGLMARALFEEIDLNNSNFSKEGVQLDFEYSKPWAHLLNLQEKASVDEAKSLLRQYHLLPQPLTASSLEKFPDRESPCHYWPTQHKEMTHLCNIILKLLIECRDNTDRDSIIYKISLSVTQAFREQNPSLINKISAVCYQGYLSLKALWIGQQYSHLLEAEEKKYIFNCLILNWQNFCAQNKPFIQALAHGVEKVSHMEERLFTPEDNKNYKNLALHPVVIYHRNISLLKYLLTTEAHYRALSKLHITGTSREHLVTDEAKNIDNLRKEIIQSPSFRQFILDDDGYAYQVVFAEFKEMKQKYEAKLGKKPFYQELVDSFDLKQIELNYQALRESILGESKKAEIQNEPIFSL